MAKKASHAGIDVGSLYLKIVWTGEDGAVLGSFYEPHYGDAVGLLKRELAGFEGSGAVTGSRTELVASILPIEPVNHIQSIIECVTREFPRARNIIDIGGNTATYIELTDRGRFKYTNSNSICAAGTGSFLDEQAGRIDLSYDRMAEIPVIDDPPRIAARCSVFAKTDLVHRQQQGYSRGEMWAGLCRGMVQTCLTTLLKGRRLEGLTVLTGGVSQNHHIMHWMERELGDDLVTFPLAHLAPAIGALHLATRKGSLRQLVLRDEKEASTRKIKPRRQPLVLEKSKPVSFDVHRSYRDRDGTEVRQIAPISSKRLEVFIGIDVGSTSTKAVLTDRSKRVVLDAYRKTLGDPVEAMKRLLRAIRDWADGEGVEIEFLGAGTTGSGREMIGRIVGADLVVNEITAHGTAASEEDPSIDTIFEIGGQDSKYIRMVNGFMRDSRMNYVCAAGTGSFIEEQAKKLGYAVEDVGDAVLGVAPPITSDRCTVFMEQDIQVLLGEGFSREEVLAATVYSIAQNYLTRVAGGRIGHPEKIFFLGATARNRGLVAAFERLLGAEVKVSPFCHVMGAYGVTLLLAKNTGGTGFIGFDFIDQPVSLSEETCTYCSNYCTITTASVEGGNRDVSWGYLCGRDPDDTKRKRCEEFRMMEKRNELLGAYLRPIERARPTIGMPRALTSYSNLPLWSVFLGELGFNLALSPRTTPEIASSGVHASGTEFCHPARVSVGHILALLDDPDIDHVFVPSHLETFRIPEVTKSWYCPLVIQNPYYSRAVLRDHPNIEKLFSASVNFNWPVENVVRELVPSFGERLGASARHLEAAWDKAIAAQREFEERCQEQGKLYLEELSRNPRDCIVILGRPYSVYDYGMNLNLPRRIAEYGYPVIPLEFVPYDERARGELTEAYWNLYWAYGQRILSAVEYIARHPNLHPLCFTNFKCGPDSYVLTYVESSIQEKPLLTLEFDEHNSEGGYITRLEAFFDTIEANPVKVCPKYEAGMVIRDLMDIDKKEPLYIPNSPDNMTEAYAAVFRRFGFDARVCPPVDEEMYNLGRSFTRGSECSPAVEMGSNFLRVLETSDEEVFHFAMADSRGPCRMGQYSYLYNVIFKHFPGRKIDFVNVQMSVDTADSINPEIKKSAYRGMVLLDLLQKCLHKTRPHEIEKGRALEAYRRHRALVLRALESGEPLEPVFDDAVEAFRAIPVRRGQRPLVGIVGEYFVTTSPFINQNLVEVIEECGGEAWLVPHADFILWYSVKDFQVLDKLRPVDEETRRRHERTIAFLQGEEHRWISRSGGFLDDRSEPAMSEIYAEAVRYMHEDVPNETLPTVGRAVLFARRDKASLIVNCKPFSCMPGNASEAILQRVKSEYDIPIVSVNYEGTGDANQPVRTMLLNIT